MLDTSRLCGMALAVLAAGCATLEPATPEAPAKPAPSASAKAPPGASADAGAVREASRALLAQAETDIQRARSKRALWLGAWEALIAARQAAQAEDPAATMRHARRASELAELGLEQLAYPALE